MLIKITDANLGYLGEIGTFITYANPPGNMLEMRWFSAKSEGYIIVDIDSKVLEYIKNRYNPKFEVINNGEKGTV